MSNPQPSTSRRAFVKSVAAGAAAAVGAGVTPGPVQAAVRAVQYAMVIDTRRCIGCHACSVACKAEFDVPLGETRSWVEYVEKGEYPNVSRHFLPRLCNHCSNPQCVNVCPTGATYKRAEDGIVVVDADVCIGCKYCIQACPYDVRYLHPDRGTVDKCDFCLHRVSQGLVPSCVNTCQGRARIFGDMNDPDSEVAKILATNPVTVLRQGMGTEPNVYYIAADHSDERDRRFDNHYVRVTTHRRAEERR
ncbi:MAG: 4Fe-4S dicluster domain-containing protein [Rhodospirillales bacterium]|jgi:tetrathionate reductase subunit B|nr:4Fe-4S dicluster domain-containing protein [Rhodospirillales bacterium]